MGSITKRKDGRYMGRLTINGVQRCVYAKTIKDCKIKLLELEKLKSELEENESLRAYENITLWLWISDFLEMFKKPVIKATTYHQYWITIKRFEQISTFKKKLRLITHYDLNAFYNECDKNYSSYPILKEAFDKAREIGIIKINPMAMIVKPKKQDTIDSRSQRLVKTNTENEIINDETYNCFISYLQTLRNKSIELFFKILYYTGIRRGECLGLTYNDIDMENKYIVINKNVGLDNKVYTTKSVKGTRKVPIFNELYVELDKWLNKHDGDKLFNFGYTLISRVLARYKEKSGIDIHCHQFRKTFVSLCQFKYGIDKSIVAEWVGHESTNTTEQYYTFLTSDANLKAIEKRDSINDTPCKEGVDINSDGTLKIKL